MNKGSRNLYERNGWQYLDKCNSDLMTYQLPVNLTSADIKTLYETARRLV